MIQRARYNWPEEVALDSSILNLVIRYAAHNGPRHILPRLSVVHFALHDEESWQCTPALFSPTLTQVSFILHDKASKHKIQFPFTLLPQASPLLTHVRISAPTEFLWSCVDRLATMFTHLEHITEVMLHSSLITAPPLWAALSDLPNLRLLLCEFQAPGTRDQAIPGPTFPFTGFASLCRLELFITLSKAIDLFSSSIPESLHAVDLCIIDVHNALDVERYITVAASACHRLTRFKLSYTAECPIDIAHVQPLLSHHELEILELAMPLHFFDEDVRQIALAFPNLIHLCLRPFECQVGSAPFTTEFTLGALLPLAKYCAALVCLDIYFTTFTPPPKPNQAGYTTTTFKSLQQLGTWMSSVPERKSLAVALFLESICPSTTDVVFATDPDPGPDDGCDWLDNYDEDLAGLTLHAEYMKQYTTAEAEWDVVREHLALLRDWKTGLVDGVTRSQDF